MQRFIRYEGGQIGISGDRRAAADWYCRHLGMTELWDGEGEGQTLLQFPGRAAAIPLVSVAGSVWSGPGRPGGAGPRRRPRL